MTVTELPPPTDRRTVPGTRRLGDNFRGAEDRWVPTRAGLVNVWQYSDETFELERGRLVLFGPNGSGKTMALELLFPYLLDANAAPYRLSTAGGTERGGLWSRISGYDVRSAGRIGYLWAEFTRRHHDGTTETFTCGTRLEPRGGNNGGKHTWFTTSLCVGHDLALLDADRIPLTPKELKAAVEDSGAGRVWGDDTVGYRTTVRSTLYSDFSEDQYAAMIEGLLAVRKQSITDGLNPEKLHLLLSDGLPPLDARELDQVARGFEGLDAQREAILELESAVSAADALTERVRRHAAAVLNLAAKNVTNATSNLDGLTRTRRTAKEDLTRHSTAEKETSDKLTTTTDETEELKERRLRIYASPGYKSIGELDRVTKAVADQRGRAAKASSEASRVEGVATDARNSADGAEDVAKEAKNKLVAKDRELRTLARGARIDVPDDITPAAAAELIDTEARVRRLALGEVRAALGKVTGVERDVAGERDALDRAEGLKEQHQGYLNTATSEVAEAVTAWTREVHIWATGLTELSIDPTPLELALADAALDTVSGLATTAGTESLTALSRADETFVQRLEQLKRERVVFADEHDALSSNAALTPPAAASWRTRRVGGQTGAALWELLIPNDVLEHGIVDALETALDASGILDAWVHPDGHVALDDLGTRNAAAADTSTLAEYLHVDDQAAAAAGVDPTVVRSVLTAVAVAAEATGDVTCVGLDASFTYGPVHGRPTVRPARYLGAAARERSRLARLAELEVLIAEIETKIGELEASRGGLAARANAARAEMAGVPDGAPVREAQTKLTAAEGRLESAESAVGDARHRLEITQSKLVTARNNLARVAAQHGLPVTATELDVVGNHLHDAERAALQLPEAVARAEATGLAAEEAAWLAETRRADAERVAMIADEEQRDAKLGAAGLAELEANVGADASVTQARLTEVNDHITVLVGRIETLQGQLSSAHDAALLAANQLEALVERYDNAKAARDVAEAQFRTLVDAGVAADAGFDGGWDLSTATGVRSATREVNSARGATEPTHAIAQREKTRLDEARYLHSGTLTGRAELNLTELEVGDLPAVRATAVIGGVTVSFAALAVRLRDELQRSRDELVDAESDLFEQTLTGSLRAHLASRLRAAQGLVDAMNNLLSQIRSASGGVAVSLRWDVADDVEDRTTLRTIKELLLRDHHSTEERDSLFSFLSRRVDQVRATDRAVTSWRDALERLFDYRLWHRFSIMVRHDRFGDTPVAFTSRKVSLSTGEKKLVLSLPLFAAIASHYMPRDVGGEPRTCPRFLLLDEIFPNNDRPNKRQILSLLTELELDAVMTSDKDMCDYDTVDGIAIAVIHKDGDGSYSTRLVWNGYETIPEPADAGTGPHSTEQGELPL